MFGYVTINKPELKVKDYEKYHAYYCGLCKVLKRKYGALGQLTLTFDMTFLIVLLSGLYEPEEKREAHRCIAHPAKKHVMRYNEITEYAADMNIILAYHNLMDDWTDDRNIGKLSFAKILERSYRKLEKKYERQAAAVNHYMETLTECEKRKESSLDMAAGLTGEMLGEIFNYREDEWAETLKKLGFYLGKFIYLCDASEDVEKDKKSGSYNPFLLQEKDIDKREILNLMMADCTREFEKLPILLNADILRNILYAGVWQKFERIQAGATKEETGVK
ncbi:DUF5685 family protein [Anaerocolumna xylanovorans]|uniref:Uncharacterized protein n=1 Tax=Anaerocolumna xylanovorans DSM 12503 TaxID=1121345 RepID=A0A1M7Y475_9FIRM|nr:DUF5685 family protein [Anaerocolumna xylanovorans]SHO47075.1 hypothetical protein SAMN02745217_01388 [Anaerocolumna xylanovorans DSM 12503]